MKKILTGLALAAALLAPISAMAEPAATAPGGTTRPTTRVGAAPKELAETIKQAIVLLEAGKNKELIELLAPAAEIEKRGIDKMVEKFAPRSQELLARLKEAQTQEPTLSSDDRALYPKSEGKEQIRFFKLDGKWYLK